MYLLNNEIISVPVLFIVIDLGFMNSIDRGSCYTVCNT